SPASASVESARETTALSRPLSCAIRLTPRPPLRNASASPSRSRMARSRVSPEVFRRPPRRSDGASASVFIPRPCQVVATASTLVVQMASPWLTSWPSPNARRRERGARPVATSTWDDLLVFLGRRWDDVLTLFLEHAAVVVLSLAIALVLGLAVGVMVWNRPLGRSMAV